jgi:8-oxo-dGTP pyrophosphatase MutT (NUDIX family)
MSEDKYIRKVQTSVTNFIYCGDEFLMLKRSAHKRIDPNKLNGVGGRVDPGEDMLNTVIRETAEETGYKITTDQIQFRGLLKLEGGYDEDWIVGIFLIEVHDKTLPIGSKTADGELMWIHKDKVLDTEYELIDDLKYYFKQLIDSTDMLFMNAQMDQNEKVTDFKISILKHE